MRKLLFMLGAFVGGVSRLAADGGAEVVSVGDEGLVAKSGAPTELALELGPGLSATLWADERLLANPMALSADGRGRLFVAESHRYRSNALDLRDHPELIERDLSSRSLEDRARLLAEVFGEQLTYKSERVMLVEDKGARGVADGSRIFAAGFDSAVDGAVGGVLAWGDAVWLANVPALWRLGVDTGGVMVSRDEVLRGFGVHIGEAGHDLHGPVIGPDGWLYFSMGDRGAHLTGPDGVVIDVPDTGAVFRCQTDGRRLELLAEGLRNPRGLAFDDRGNLVVADSAWRDGGPDRLVLVVEGSDSGWHLGLRHIPIGPDVTARNEPESPEASSVAPAYRLPPIALIEAGSRGMAHHPGTGLRSDDVGAFFLSHFTGRPADSGVNRYVLQPQGAGLTLVDVHTVLRGALATDVVFGVDGRLYVADWVSSWPWPKSGRGRIHAVDASEFDERRAALVRDTTRVLAEGMSHRTAPELAGLLGNRDQRVRLNAQHALAGRGAESMEVFSAVAGDASAPRLARLHALWGMGQLADRVPAALNDFPGYLADADGEVRAHAAKLIGDCGRFEFVRPLLSALHDPDPRVAGFAAQSLGKLKRPEAISGLIELLRRNEDRDVVLRQMVVVALARLGPHPALARASEDPSRAVRLGGLLAYRRLGDPAVASYLQDFDPDLVREAARAINDRSIDAALPALASMLEVAPLDDSALVRRAINAHFRLGEAENAAALAGFASRPYVPVELRAEALAQLAGWGAPPARDRITGLYRPLPARDVKAAQDALREFIAALSGRTPERLQIAVIEATAALGLPGIGHALWDVVYQRAHPVAARVAALRALAQTNDARLEVAAQTAGRSQEVELRLAALEVLATLDPAVSLPTLEFLARQGGPEEQAVVYRVLGSMDDERADQLIERGLRRLVTSQVPATAQAELLEAAAARTAPAVEEMVAQVQEHWINSGDPLAPYRSALVGGDKVRGRILFERHPLLACQQCHAGARDPGHRGPLLDGIGGQRTGEELLESVLFGHAKHGAGVGRNAGQPDDPRAPVTDRGSASPVIHAPAGVARVLSRIELRDLLAYLSSLRDPTPLERLR